MNRKKAKVLRKIVKGTVAPVVSETVKRIRTLDEKGEVVKIEERKMTAHPIKSWRRNYQDAKIQMGREHSAGKGILKGRKV